MTDAGKTKEKIISKDRMSFSRQPFYDKNLLEVAYDFDLPKVRQQGTVVNLDRLQQGLSNASCGPIPLRIYIIPVEIPQFYSFRIHPEGW